MKKKKPTRFDRINEQREDIVKVLIEKMSAEGIGWTRSWRCPISPFNPVSATRYAGINQFNLSILAMIRGYEDPRWLTFKQAKSLGFKVKKGAKSAAVEKWGPVQVAPKDESGNIVKEAPIADKRFVYRCLSYFTVFNAEDIEGIEPFEAPTVEHDDEALGKLADILESSSRCPVIERATSSACYIPSNDKISLPYRASFSSITAFLQVLMHEMGHSTGHPGCLNRGLSTKFGSDEYAREELVAELTSMFCSAEIGIEAGHTPGNEHYDRHVAYFQSWTRRFEEKPEEIFNAAQAATKAADFILGRFASAGGILVGDEAFNKALIESANEVA